MALNEKALNYEHKSNCFLSIPILKKPAKSAKPGENRIRQAFLDVPMILSHSGLTDLAHKAGIRVEEMKRGDFLLFVNASWTKVKLLGPGNILVYLAAPNNGRINPAFLKELPKVFNSDSQLTYDEAMRSVFEKYLLNRLNRKKKIVETSPLN